MAISVGEITLIDVHDGEDGAQGIQGPVGPKGDKGDTGSQGPQGIQGIQGPKGDQGIQGPVGADGTSSYTHIAYATGTSGQNFSVSHFAGATYIGIYVDQNPADSTNYTSYNWTLIKGADGANGLPGPTGADGLTAYFHTAWADNATGTSGFSTTVSTDKLYLGTYTDHTEADSTDPTKYAWSLIKGADGAQGPPGADGAVGPQGPAGPPGVPGFLGLYSDGDTLYLKGYAGDGTLTATIGYIHIAGVRYTVPEHSQLLTGEGQGYVVFDGTSVQFARMNPQPNSIEWLPYNGGAEISATYIIGKFKRTGASISEETIVTPMAAEVFTKSHFMEILANGGYADLTLWAGALGVQQVFESLAVWDFFADKIKVNHLEIEKLVNGELFKLILSNNEGSDYPILQAWRGSTLVFEINSSEGSVFIRGGGEFEGTIKHEALETIAHADGDSFSESNTKSLWSTTELYDEITSITADSSIKVASGSYDDKTINGITRLTAGARALISQVTQPNSYKSRNDDTYVCFGIFTVPSGCNYLTINYQLMRDVVGIDSAIVYISRNTELHEFAVGHVIIEHSFSPLPSGDRIYWSTSKSPGTTWTDYSYALSVSAGQRFSIWVSYDVDYEDDDSRGAYGANAVFTAYSSIIGPGVFFKYTDNTYHIIPTGQYRDDVLALTSPAWASSGNINFKKGTDLFNNSVVQGLQTGIVYPANGTATIHPAGGVSATYTVQSIRRDASGVTLGTTAGDVAISNWGGQGSTQGVYSDITVSITIVGQLRAIRASSILPRNHGDGKDQNLIGSGTEPFVSGYFTNVYATTVNATTVYGARFN